MSASQTGLAKLGIGTADPVTIALNYGDFDPGVELTLRDCNQSKGVFHKDKNRVVDIRHLVKPRFSSEPTAAELAPLLEWGMWGTPTGTTVKTYPISDTPAERYVHFAPRVGEQWFLGGVGVNQMTLRAAVGEPLSIDLDLLGKTWDDTKTTFPTLSLDQTTRPFTLARCALVVDGVARKTSEFMFSINHNLESNQRYLNSLTLTELVKTDQQIMAAINVPSGDNSGLWDTGLDGATLVATFTNGFGGELVLTFANLFPTPRSPVHGQRGEGFLRLEGEAYRTGSASPVVLTLDATG